MKDYTYNEHINRYFFDCTRCNIKVCGMFKHNLLCNKCYNIYKIELKKILDEYDVNRFKDEHYEGEEANKIEEKLKGIDDKVKQLNILYNI